MHYALDRSPGPEVQVGLAGFGWTWDFSSLACDAAWIETLRPAATGAGAEFFGDAMLVYTQTGPASVQFRLLPGSNGSEADLRVMNLAAVPAPPTAPPLLAGLIPVGSSRERRAPGFGGTRLGAGGAIGKTGGDETALTALSLVPITPSDTTRRQHRRQRAGTRR